MKKRILALVLALAFIGGCLPLSVSADEEETVAAESSDAVATDATVTDANTAVSIGVDYLAYAEENAAQPVATQSVTVQGETGVVSSGDASVVTSTDEIDYDAGAALLTEEGSVVTWTVTVPESARYTLTFCVSTESAKKSNAQRSLTIDGTRLFDEMRELIFTRYWVDVAEDAETAAAVGYEIDEYGYKLDAQGNELRPDSEAAVVLQDQLLSGDSGDAFEFYLTAGTHTFTLEANKEVLVIDSLTLAPSEDLVSYQEYSSAHASAGVAGTETIRIEAEKTSAKSSYAVYPVFDRTSALNSPQNTRALSLNVIGGSDWQSVGQWISWDITVPTTGNYQIAVRFRQDSLRGVSVHRALEIDGAIPFAEAGDITFPYANKWQTMLLGDDEQTYSFYLEAGTHTITMRVVMGDLYQIVEKVNNALTELNICYRSILSITGTSPDVNRDYSFATLIPEVLADLAEQADVLREAAADLKELTGEEGQMYSILQTNYNQLDKMTEKPRTIAKQFATFKSNLGTLGDWVYSMSNQPLLLDYFEVSSSDDYELPRAEADFFTSLVFNTELFISSFLIDYNSTSSADNADTVVVWVQSGRDQYNIISSLTSESFEVETGYKASVRLVSAAALLPSILSGRGPDVALGNAHHIAVDYGLRDAVLDLTEFDDLDEVLGRFASSAVDAVSYKGSVYGLPENETWPMMFVRTDVLTELGLSAPTTWNELISIIPVLERQNLTVGLMSRHVSTSGGESTTVYGYQGYLQMLYQNGGQLYAEQEDGSFLSGLDTNEALSAFETWCNMFTKYDLPLDYNEANRFRSGEMPIVLAEYTAFYNNITVFAPEISGLWEMLPIPGVLQDDGTINNTVVTTTTAAIIMKSTTKKEAAWEYLKWWTSSDTQTSFGVEMEAVLGPSAKQATANLEALEQLPWTVKEYTSLESQLSISVGMPVVPGYYQTERLVGFSFSDVYNNNLNPIEELEDDLDSINNELTRKYEEFSSLAEDSQ